MTSVTYLVLFAVLALSVVAGKDGLRMGGFKPGLVSNMEEAGSGMQSDATGLCEYFEEWEGAPYRIFSLTGLSCEVCYVSCYEQVHPFSLEYLDKSYKCPVDPKGVTKCNCNYRKWNSGELYIWSDSQSCDNGFGDPHFIGFDGTSFDFMGIHGGVFNVYSDASHQVNALLDNFGMSDSTFIKSIGFKFGPSLKVEMASNSAQMVVAVNGERLDFNGTTKLFLGELLVEAADTNKGGRVVIISTPTLKLKVSKRSPEALHLNINLSMVRQPVGKAEGVLGQTLQWMTEGKPAFHGDEGELLVSDIFADDFARNQFTGADVPAGNSRKLLMGLDEELKAQIYRC